MNTTINTPVPQTPQPPKLIGKETTRKSTFIMGMIAGCINALAAFVLFIIAVSSDSPSSIVSTPTQTELLIVIMSLLVALVNLTGAILCKPKRQAGGIMMMASALILLILVAAFMPWMSILIIVELLSITAGVLTFIPYKDDYINQYNEQILKAGVVTPQAIPVDNAAVTNAAVPDQPVANASPQPDPAPINAKVCPKCGAYSPAGKAFCGDCGYPL